MLACVYVRVCLFVHVCDPGLATRGVSVSCWGGWAPLLCLPVCVYVCDHVLDQNDKSQTRQAVSALTRQLNKADLVKPTCVGAGAVGPAAAATGCAAVCCAAAVDAAAADKPEGAASAQGAPGSLMFTFVAVVIGAVVVDCGAGRGDTGCGDRMDRRAAGWYGCCVPVAAADVVLGCGDCARLVEGWGCAACAICCAICCWVVAVSVNDSDE